MRLTKMDMAKIIVTALYNLPKLVTEDQSIYWRTAIKLSRRTVKHLTGDYNKAIKVIQERI